MSSSTTIGANEDMFLKAFDDTPRICITTTKSFETELQRTLAVISNQSADWDNRVKAFKTFRSLMNSEPTNSDDYIVNILKTLEVSFQNNLRDLRSQVVRETCITIAFLSCKLQQKFARMAEVLLASLIKLIPNSAKIMSSSALVALRFIVQSTQSSRFLPIIRYQLNSKCKEIRRALCELIERIVTLWSPIIIERALVDLQEVIRLGICDSDEQARQFARRAFNIFAEHFKPQAEKLYKSLDPQKQRMLSLNRGGGSTLSVNGVSSSLAAQEDHVAASSHLISSNNYKSTLTNSNNHHSHHIPSSASSTSSSSAMLSRFKNIIPINPATNNRSPTARSTSAIDVAAQRRAKARAICMSPAYRNRQFQAAQSAAANNHHNNHHQLQHQHPQNNSDFKFSQPQDPIPYQSNTPRQNRQQQQQQQLLSLSPFTLPNINSLSLNDRPTSRLPQRQPTPLSPEHVGPDNVDSNHKQAPDLTVKSALSRAAAYLESLVNSTLSHVDENQIVTAIKYFRTIIEKSATDSVKECASDIMPPLAQLLSHKEASVRKASTCALVAVHESIGIELMEPYLSQLTPMTRKILDVYIEKSRIANGNGNSGDTPSIYKIATTPNMAATDVSQQDETM